MSKTDHIQEEIYRTSEKTEQEKCFLCWLSSQAPIVCVCVCACVWTCQFTIRGLADVLKKHLDVMRLWLSKCDVAKKMMLRNKGENLHVTAYVLVLTGQCQVNLWKLECYGYGPYASCSDGLWCFYILFGSHCNHLKIKFQYQFLLLMITNQQ